ncbi:MAG TPA: amylo-alpha-1,6-glucosidase [Thermoanaerobaculia bacterium]|jgi:predicted glycogen debranching enzyme|nr:amylo-alpha-1,6-glucosidase [Thermoanaerobaculia bacterium]
MTFERDVCADFARSSALEWLEANGLGGWASSTVSGAHTRRYHGLLVAATEPPGGRKVLLSRLDETVEVGEEKFELGANRFPGVIHPRGFEHLARFRQDLFPTWEYEIGTARLLKTIAAVHLEGDENATLVLYELAQPSPPAPLGEGPGVRAVRLMLRPFFAGRDFHSLGHANDSVHRGGTFEADTLVYQSYDGLPTVHLNVPGGAYSASPDWWCRFEYDLERERGLDFEEDLFTPGTIAVELAPGARLGVLISTAPPAGGDAWDLFDAERERREKLLAPFIDSDPFVRALALAADAFVVRRGRRGAGLSTVIAGYPWFSDWGRDSMIALPGLCLVTQRFDEAKGILRSFARATSEGLLPNRFPDSPDEAPEYNTADATLWFFVAAWKYFEATGDAAFVRDELMPVFADILAWHERGTRHGIRVESDGLLHAGEPGVQLTWMDAKVGDWVVTPRSGLPVEIQALWANALAITSELCDRFGQKERAAELRLRAEQVRERFAERFWNEEAGGLFDVVDGNWRDASVRPNQIFALSLPFPLLERERAARMLAQVETKLLTPRGLRTLSADDPRYRPVYLGGPLERDGAYHQGTVWPWLLGPYISALVRVRGEEGKRQGREILEKFAPHLAEAGIGTVSEIFDAEPPHAPRGCPAQAWSVGELLRVAVEVSGL